MQRMLRYHSLAVHGMERGRVRVVPEFHDRERGEVRCPAAPLVGTWISDWPAGAVEHGPVAQGGGDAVLVAASYIDRRGAVTGLGVAAHRSDLVALEAAENAVRQWVSVLRSRRVLIADAAMCPGGSRAVRMIEDAPKPLTVLSGSYAGPEVQGDLTGTARVHQVDAGGMLAFPAHGADARSRAEAAAHGLRALDATCPLVAAAQADATAYAARGDLVMVVGSSTHAVTSVLAAEAGEAAVVVETAEEAEHLIVPPDRSCDRIAFVVDPALPVENALAVVGALRRRFPALAGHHFDILCEHASDQAASRAAVASVSELTLVLAADRADARVGPMAREIARSGGRGHLITALGDLHAELLAGVMTLGLITGPFTPPVLERQVVDALSGLGPLTIRRRTVRTSPLFDSPWSLSEQPPPQRDASSRPAQAS